MFRSLRLYQVVTDVSIAVVFFAIAWPIEATLFVPMGLESRFGYAITMILAGLIAALFSVALVFRRFSPALALAVAWLGALVQMGLGRSPSFADVAIFGVLYASAAYGSRRVYWSGLVSAVIGAVVIVMYLMLGPAYPVGGLTWQTLPIALLMLVAAVFALGLSWTLGALARSATHARNTRAAQLRAELDAAAEQQRVRIARDMHDVVAHSLAVVIAQADGARYALSASDGGAGSAIAVDALGTIASTARAALGDVRVLLTQLRHSQPEGPQPGLADLEDLYDQVRAAGVELRVHADGAPSAEPTGAVQLAVYRIVQEALTNALRHGDAGPVDVRMSWSETAARGRPGVDLEVRNGLRAGDHPQHSGHGLIGMGERAALVGGWLNAADSDDQFVVSATIPAGYVQ